MIRTSRYTQKSGKSSNGNNLKQNLCNQRCCAFEYLSSLQRSVLFELLDLIIEIAFIFKQKFNNLLSINSLDLIL